MWEAWVQSLGREDSLEKEMATHPSTLAWKIPWTKEPGAGYCPWAAELDMTEQLHLCARGFPHSSIGKEPTCNAGDPGSWVGKISWTRGRRATPVFSSFPVGSAGKVAQLCRTLCDPMDYTVHGIFQARILKWVAFPFSVGPSQPRDQTPVLGSFFWGGGRSGIHSINLNQMSSLIQSTFIPFLNMLSGMIQLRFKVNEGQG